MSSRSFYFVLLAVSVKFALDFFVPVREFSFVAFNGVLALLLLILRPRVYLNWRIIGAAAIATACVLFQLVRDPLNMTAYKLLTLPVLAALMYGIGSRMKDDDVYRLSKIVLFEFLVCFIANYAISMALGLIRSRSFWNFEHPNLLGSYVLVMLIPANFILLRGLRHKGVVRVMFIACAYLTTSTGALILSAGVYARARSFRLRNVIILIGAALVFSAVGLSALSFLDQGAFRKIAAPFLVIYNGGWGQLVEAAKHGDGMTYLAGDQQGSFTWRIYAYLVYTFYLLHQDAAATLFGNGIGGYTNVWNGAMPHNDFILVFVDFGILVFACTVWIALKAIRNVVVHAPSWTFVMVALLLRLTAENNIYSYYLVSHAVLFSALMMGVETRRVQGLHLRREVQHGTGSAIRIAG